MSLYDYSFAAKPIAALSAAPKGFSGTAFDFQHAAVQQFNVRKHPYFAHHPGAGKTPMALLASRYYSESDLVIVICPPSIVGQWVRQALKWTGLPWTPLTSTLEVRDLMHDPRSHLPCRFVIPDTLTHTIPDRPWKVDLLIWDEAHRGKSRDAVRTKAFFGHDIQRGIAQRAEKVLCLSGTPMPNSPVELYPFLHFAYPLLAPTFADFAKAYCPPSIKRIKVYNKMTHGFTSREILVYENAINKDVLARKLREGPFVRPKKEDVLGQLPPLREETIYIKTGMSMPGMDPAKIARIWTGYIAASADEKEALSKARHALGLRKAQLSIDYLQTLVEGGEAPLVWCWHRDAAILIAEKLGFSLCHGGLTPDERTLAIDDFVAGRTPGFVGTIAAAGTGIDGFQTRTDLCVFVERSYVPLDADQAVGRLLRIGQKGAVRCVTIDSEHPIDAGIEMALTRKRADIAEIVG